MARLPRVDIGNIVYHILNRANARLSIFHTREDYRLFESILEEAQEKFNMRILAYCIMPNHWHLVVYPKYDGELAPFMQWITLTHTQRHHATHQTIGGGHLYQGRYKSFLVQTDGYLQQLLRYVEHNPVRASLVIRAEDWQWSSVYRRERGTIQQQKLLTSWPITMPTDYLTWVNESLKEDELTTLRYSTNKGKPYGRDDWVATMIKKFKLDMTTRLVGRPKNGT